MASNQSFTVQVQAMVDQAKLDLETVFHVAVQDLVSEIQEPGPSKATAKMAIAVAEGLKGKGKKANRVGPIPNPGGSGNLPVANGFLRASFMMSKGGYDAREEYPEKGKKYEYAPQPAELTINSAKIGEVLYGTYGAAYARHVHYGTKHMSGRQWVTLAAQRWQQIVDEAVQKVRART